MTNRLSYWTRMILFVSFFFLIFNNLHSSYKKSWINILSRVFLKRVVFWNSVWHVQMPRLVSVQKSKNNYVIRCLVESCFLNIFIIVFFFFLMHYPYSDIYRYVYLSVVYRSSVLVVLNEITILFNKLFFSIYLIVIYATNNCVRLFFFIFIYLSLNTKRTYITCRSLVQNLVISNCPFY